MSERVGKEKPKLNFRFHHPNPEQLVGTILQVCIEANIPRVDELLAHDLMENQEKAGEKNGEKQKSEGGISLTFRPSSDIIKERLNARWSV